MSSTFISGRRVGVGFGAAAGIKVGAGVGASGGDVAPGWAVVVVPLQATSSSISAIGRR
jgi:hypothetical protein